MEIISNIKEVIRQEAEAVLTLLNFINEDFENAIKYIHHTKNKLVISGIGKSAHIGKKIVATLNSTGTSSVFMHASEAIHGDLGIVQADDAVMIISKSGESAEITNLILALKTLQTIKNINIKIIAMVGNTNSTLAKNADFILNASIEKEACPNNLAPTSSTTCQMVLGDAMAVALMKLNHFTDKDFANFHPGGALGKRLLLTVKSLIHQKPQVSLDTNLKEVIVAISQGRQGASAVTDGDGNVLGVITDGDIRRYFSQNDNLNQITAKQIMNPNPKTIDADILASHALTILNKNNINQLIIINANKKYCGIVHIHDILKEGIN